MQDSIGLLVHDLLSCHQASAGWVAKLACLQAFGLCAHIAFSFGQSC